jgi:phospholipid/cholesterol/gamma-HCH transport system permease protein
MESLAFAISAEDVILFLVKNIFSGSMIFMICCYQGLQVKQSFTEVPQVTTKAVMNSIFYTVCFNSFVTLVSYISHLRRMGII